MRNNKGIGLEGEERKKGEGRKKDERNSSAKAEERRVWL